MSDPWRIPQTWAWVKSHEIAEIVGGGTPPTDDHTNFDGGEVPWITPADLSGYKDKHIAKGARNITKKGLDNSGARVMPKGTVLFSSRAPIGYVAIAANPVSTNQGFKSFVLHPFIKSDYAYYYLQRAKELAVELSSGTTFREISGAKAALIPFPVAPIAEQDRIVAEIEIQFTRLDAAVTTLKRVQANLKRFRAAVLKAACEGRLVPTEAELARREGRSYEPASVLLERILAERRSRWEAMQVAKFSDQGKQPTDHTWKRRYKEPSVGNAVDLPQLPDGWLWVSVEAISTKVVDGVHKKPTYVPHGIPFVTVKNLTAGPGISFDHLNYVTKEAHYEFIRRADPEEHDLLITKDGTLGVVRKVRTQQEFSIFVSVAMIKPVLREMADYLEIALSAPQVQVQMVPKGSGLQHIHLEDLRQDCIPIPPLAEQARVTQEVARRISVIEEVSRELSSELRRATTLRQSILKRAFEGKLVPQDSNNESASALLEQIRSEREATVAKQTPRKIAKRVVSR